MLPEKSLGWGQSKSCIRELFEYGTRRKAEIGADRVFDFSIGNPSVPAPDCVAEAIKEVAGMDSVELHGYTPAAGLPSFRAAIAHDLNARFDAGVSSDMVYVTCGAAAGLASCMHGLLLPGEEVIVFAPFFPEYRVFAEAAGGVLVSVPPMTDLQPDLSAFEAAITEKTKVVIVNTPNNPSGVVLSADTLAALAAILRRAKERFGRAIYLVSDEPYRELVYDAGAELPCVTHFYDNSIICYSFSKSLSLPGERVGYLAVGDKMADRELVFASLAGAARACGYVNAPSMMQRVIERCIGQTVDISEYGRSRELLCSGLTRLGFECVRPDGAFYLFVKAPEPDAKAFSERAKAYELLLVPSDDFGLEGYVRVAYCVSSDLIERAMPAFELLARDYGLI